MLKVYTGSMKSNKSLELIKTVERLSLMKKRFRCFNPSFSGVQEISSRIGLTTHAIIVSEVLDIFQYINENTDAILIDEVQFLCKSEDDLSDLLFLVKYCEIDQIDLYVFGLSLDFKNEPFQTMKELLPYADEITINRAVCEECFNADASKTLRLKNGMPCKFDDEVFVSKEDDKVVYRAVCKQCYYKSYERRKCDGLE